MAFAAWPHLAGAFFPIRSVQHSDPAWTGSCEQGEPSWAPARKSLGSPGSMAQGTTVGMYWEPVGCTDRLSRIWPVLFPEFRTQANQNSCPIWFSLVSSQLFLSIFEKKKKKKKPHNIYKYGEWNPQTFSGKLGPGREKSDGELEIKSQNVNTKGKLNVIFLNT